MSESDNFNRSIRLLAKGGTMVMRRILDKYSDPLSFSDYIYQNQMKILQLKFYENQRGLVVSRAVDKMDITLLGKLVLGLFKDTMTDNETSCINAIKVERDKFLHSEILELAKISTEVFDQRWQIISTLLRDLADEVGEPDFRTQLEDFIEETKKGYPDLAEIHATLIEWCQSNKELQMQIESVATSVEELKGLCLFLSLKENEQSRLTLAEPGYSLPLQTV